MVQTRQKPCQICNQLEPVFYRVKYGGSGQWGFESRRCWDTVSQNNQFYVYGDTWKAKK